MPLGSFRLNGLAKKLVEAIFTRSAVQPRLWASMANGSHQFHNFGKFGRSYWSPGIQGNIPLEVRDLGTAQYFHTQNTTWEAWVYPIAWTAGAATGEASANVMGNTGSDGWCYNQFGFNNAGKLTFGYAYNNSFSTYATVQESGTSGVLNTWQHIAMVQNSGTIKLYHNGVEKASASVQGTPGYDFGNVRGFAIGSTYNNFRGYLEEIRISHTARYTSNFTPATTRFTNDQYTKLLYHCDNTQTPLGDGSYISGMDDADGTYAYNGDYISSVTAVSLIDQVSSQTQTIQIPGFAQVDDYAILFDSSSNTTTVLPSGWTNIRTNIVTGVGCRISYKKLTSGDLGSTVTGTSAGVMRKMLVIVRPNGPVTSVQFIADGNATTAVPTSYSMGTSYISSNRAGIAFAQYYSTGAITTRTGTGFERELSNSTSQYVKNWVYNQASSRPNISIGMSDGGTNCLQYFIMQFNPF